jgi:peptidoglycan/LPS O-acetylase OafA/YrhL
MFDWIKKKLPLRAYPELDGVRFLSIFLVVVHHQFFDQNAFLYWFNQFGWLGVDIFFTLSGFLITTLLLKELNDTGRINIKMFLFRRILRLWPSWLFAFIISFVMVYYFSRENQELRNALFDRWWHYLLHVANYSRVFAGKIHNFFGIFWSLAVEEHFYLFWPPMLLLIRNKKVLLSSMIGLILLPYFTRVYHLSLGQDISVHKLLTHNRIDELLMGCLLAFYMPKIKNLTSMTEALMTALMFLFFYIGLYYCNNNVDSIYVNAFSYTFIGMASCLLIIISLRGNKYGLRKILNRPLFARLGVLSYGVYLIHLQTNYVVFALLKRYPLITDQNIIALINTFLPFLPAYVMYRYLDEYFSRFKRH